MKTKEMNMKKAMMIIAVAFLTITAANAQTVNGVPMSEIDVNYVQIVGVSKAMSNKDSY